MPLSHSQPQEALCPWPLLLKWPCVGPCDWAIQAGPLIYLSLDQACPIESNQAASWSILTAWFKRWTEPIRISISRHELRKIKIIFQHYGSWNWEVTILLVEVRTKQREGTIAKINWSYEGVKTMVSQRNRSLETGEWSRWPGGVDMLWETTLNTSRLSSHMDSLLSNPIFIRQLCDSEHVTLSSLSRWNSDLP